jgi:lysozyme
MKNRDKIKRGARRINAAGLTLIKTYEGLSLRSYRCPAGMWTVGYGHTRTVAPGLELRPEQADALLLEDLRIFEKAVAELVQVPLNDNQFAALVSLAFNIGVVALGRSTLLKHLNAGQLDKVPPEFMRWTKVGTLELPGLVRRRTAEVELWGRVS